MAPDDERVMVMLRSVIADLSALIEKRAEVKAATDRLEGDKHMLVEHPHAATDLDWWFQKSPVLTEVEKECDLPMVKTRVTVLNTHYYEILKVYSQRINLLEKQVLKFLRSAGYATDETTSIADTIGLAERAIADRA